MTWNRVLIGMDFSEPAIDAAKWIAQYVAPDAELILAHVIDVPHTPTFAAAKLPSRSDMIGAAETYAASQFADVTTFLSASPIRTETRVGAPYEVLGELARDVTADVIVVGQHGERKGGGSWLGTTADRLVRNAAVPVLIMAKPRPGRVRKLLVPVEDASITPSLLATASKLAQHFGADITLLHVLSNAVYSHIASMSYAHAGTDAAAEQEIRDELARDGVRWLNELVAAGMVGANVAAAVSYGKPAEVIAETAKAIDADMIVLGRRGSSALAAALLGSTLTGVLHEGPCPVLVVPPPVITT